MTGEIRPALSFVPKAPSSSPARFRRAGSQRLSADNKQPLESKFHCYRDITTLPARGDIRKPCPSSINGTFDFVSKRRRFENPARFETRRGVICVVEMPPSSGAAGPRRETSRSKNGARWFGAVLAVPEDGRSAKQRGRVRFLRNGCERLTRNARTSRPLVKLFEVTARH